MESIVSRVSWNNQIFLNPLQNIEIYNTGIALPNKTYLIDQYARANWQCFTKKIITIRNVTVGATSDLKKILGGVYIYMSLGLNELTTTSETLLPGEKPQRWITLPS